MSYINRMEIFRRMNVGDVYVILIRDKHDIQSWQRGAARYNMLRTGERIEVEYIEQYAKISKIEDPDVIGAKIW